LLVEKTAHCYKFGPFSLNPDARVLLQDGAPVPATAKVLETLIVLVQNRGKVMTKDELLAVLWPGTVVEEANLTQNISTLRRILGDNPKDHRYIVTLPSRGYQFVSDVEFVPLGSLPAPAAEVPPSSKGVLWAGVACLAVLGLAGLVWALLNVRGSSSDAFPSREIPLTSKVGIVTLPSFSPDGKQIAYLWSPQADQNSSIYIKSIVAGTELRLTNPPGSDSFPAWSPDGQWVAFWRVLPNTKGIFAVSALGGPIRRVLTMEDGRGFGWFPDGKHLIVSGPTGNGHFRLASVDVDSGQSQPLRSDTALDEGAPAISPDGKTLAFIGSDAVRSDLYLRPMAGGPARLLLENASGVVAWTADGSAVVSNWSRPGLWRIPVKGGAPRLITSNAWSLGIPAIARHGNLLAYVVNEINENFWRIDLNRSSSQQPPPPVQLESSVRLQWDPSFSPDGRRLAFGSDRSGSAQIWSSDANGGGAVQLTHLKDLRPGGSRWSPDGAAIAFNAAPNLNLDIFVVRQDGGKPRRITTHPADDSMPSWSRDGQWIYFTSIRSGQDQIWKVPATGESSSTPAVQVTRGGGVDPFESADGKYLYFARGYEKKGLWRKQLGDDNSREEPVLTGLQHWGWWALAPRGVYFFDQSELLPKPNVQLNFLDLTSHRTSQLATLDKSLNSDTAAIALSPDNHSLIYTQTDRFGSDIMLIENFH
jgi:Tol biopolymer transport system component/DNA-binding winged helix-turn-helix (wHTH) protein